MSPMPSQHKNFEDPFGLFVRILRSGSLAGVQAMLRGGLEYGMKPVDALLSLAEPRTAHTEAEHPIVQIVGLPRSGTTLTYQVLAQALPFSCFTNLGMLFAKAPIAAARLFGAHRVSGDRGFENFYGNTRGWRAPNDGFPVWNRWLGNDRYTAELPDGPALDEMRAFFATWTRTFDRALLNKNNRNTACIGELSRAIPEMRVVEVRRDPVYVAQSLLIARERIQGSREVGWGLGAEGGPRGDDFDPLLDVALQVRRNEETMTKQRELIDPARLMQIDYEAFCREPNEHLRAIGEWVFGSASAVTREVEPFRNTNAVELPEDEFARLAHCVETGLQGR